MSPVSIIDILNTTSIQMSCTMCTEEVKYARFVIRITYIYIPDLEQ